MELVDKTLSSGSKFTLVSESQGCFLSHSIGFIEKQCPFYYLLPNIILSKLLIIRRGKKGVARVNEAYATTPIFDIKADGRAISLDDNLEDLEYPFIRLKKIDTSSHLAKLKQMEFLGWAASKFSYLKYVATTYHTGLNPAKILYIIEEAANMYQFNPKEAAKICTDTNFRQGFVFELKKFEAQLGLPLLCDNAKLTYRKLKTIIYLLLCSMKAGKGITEQDALIEYFNYYRDQFIHTSKFILDTQKKMFIHQKNFFPITNYRPISKTILTRIVSDNDLISNLRRYCVNNMHIGFSNIHKVFCGDAK